MNLKVGFLILEYEKLSKNLLECIFCSSKKITKTIMSPMISVTKEREDLKDLEKNLKSKKSIIKNKKIY